MTTSQELISIVGLPVDSDSVQALIAADNLRFTKEEDLHEGVPLCSYYSSRKLGYEQIAQSGRIITAFLYAEPTEKYKAFKGLFPGGLNRDANRTLVRTRFGIPQRSGEAFTHQFLGHQGAWDRFAVNGVMIHFQYAADEESIRLVTIMSESDAP